MATSYQCLLVKYTLKKKNGDRSGFLSTFQILIDALLTVEAKQS